MIGEVPESPVEERPSTLTVSEKTSKIAHQRSKRDERKITSKFVESAREKASKPFKEVYWLKQSLAAIEQWVKRWCKDGKQKPTVKV
jgi:hypothetical protein